MKTIGKSFLKDNTMQKNQSVLYQYFSQLQSIWNYILPNFSLPSLNLPGPVPNLRTLFPKI